jgi:DNA-binding transcriptional LysR family regulator
VGLADLREATWLLRERGSGTREVVERMLQPHLHELKTDIDLGSAQAIMTAAAEGVGITCLSLHAVRDMVKLKKLVLLRTALPRMRRTFYIIHHEHRFISPTLERFMAHCRAAYRQRR